MAHSVVFRPAAKRDLAAIYAYIRDRHGDAAVAIGYIRRIREHCEMLADFPDRGIKRDDIRPRLRILGFERRVAIAYEFDARVVRIARVFHGGRDYESLLRGRER